MLKKLARAKKVGWSSAAAQGEEDAFDDGTSALRDDGLGEGDDMDTWRVEGEDEADMGVVPSRSRLRMERAMDFGEEEARYRGKKVSRKAALLETEDTTSDEEEQEEEEGKIASVYPFS